MRLFWCAIFRHGIDWTCRHGNTLTAKLAGLGWVQIQLLIFIFPSMFGLWLVLDAVWKTGKWAVGDKIKRGIWIDEWTVPELISKSTHENLAEDLTTIEQTHENFVCMLVKYKYQNDFALKAKWNVSRFVQPPAYLWECVSLCMVFFHELNHVSQWACTKVGFWACLPVTSSPNRTAKKLEPLTFINPVMRPETEGVRFACTLLYKDC